MVYRNDGQEFGGSIYQKVNDKLQTGVQLAWTAGNNATRFGLGCKYSLDDDASVSVSEHVIVNSITMLNGLKFMGLFFLWFII